MKRREPPTSVSRSRQRRRVRLLVQRLEATYGPRPWRRRRPGLEGLIRTILSQSSSDTNSGAAFDALHRRFDGDWDAIRRAPVRRIAGAIRSAGLANVKAQRIKAILRQIQRQRGELSLEFLARLPADQARDYLGAFEGVGPKTVGCVLMFCFGMPVLPVDTHVHRLALRLGLVPPKTGAEAAHALLAPLVPDALVHPFHVLLIQHGRQVCHARSPRCGDCVLRRMCRWVRIRP
jgi:endonuclease III